MVAKFRRFLHVFVAVVCHYSGLLHLRRWLRRSLLRRREICVLGLHRVLTAEEKERTNSLDGIVMQDRTFARMLDYLNRHFQVVSLAALLDGKSQCAQGKKPFCLITFDDGWRDNYTAAYSWLKRFGLPATIFLTTGMVESGVASWVEQLRGAWKNPTQRQEIQAQLGILDKAAERQEELFHNIVEIVKHRPAEERRRILYPVPNTPTGENAVDRMLSWDQVREMSQGGIDFGTHTASHPLLTYEDDPSVERELRLSKQTVEARLGTEVRAFAYPNGDWNERIREMVKAAGYQCAFTTQPGWHELGADPYTIRRILLHEGNVTGLKGRFSPAMFNLTLAWWH